ncbi:MAG TPA: hypothetical protein VNT23_01875 [Gaiellaceae bacterium]|nr:hypothetical protein [Gaiellaceae bacterium]
MHDNPRATEEEQEQVPERLEEEQSMRGLEHGDPELPADNPADEDGSD